MKRRSWIGLLLAMTLGGPLFAQPAENGMTNFFFGRLRYSNNNGNDCASVGSNMVKLVAQVSTVPVYAQRRFSLGDPELFETPFLFMNGHDDFVLSEAELENLRTYLEHGGFLFASGCCTNPAFPKAWRRELARVFPDEEVRPLAYKHPIYRAFYKIDGVRSLHRNEDVHLEALFHEGHMVAVMCEDGLCCAFAMNNMCNVGRGVSPEDGKKLALNIAVYATTH
jgi:hypothetical protein